MSTEPIIAGCWVLNPRESPSVKIPLLRRPAQFRIFFAWLFIGWEWEDHG